MADLSSARVLMIATDGFEQDELFEPRQALLDAGVRLTLASLKTDAITGEKGGEKGDSITPDTTIDQVEAGQFDALVLPGGVHNPDTLRMEPRVIETIRAFVDAGKPVAAICHAPWLLVEADAVAGRRVTGWPSVRTDLANAGAHVVDEEVVVDGNLITSRNPGDIPAFNRAVLAALEEAMAVAA
ncbi:type 1 glutamine amidotransferase domain-containing protein [Sphingomonas hengshuiensis]|uniref:Peptidase C56 n=1 Tax=Sphingomonas hengshuiensis TaxID=1609977 RepID=A0A7U5BEW1_9SPHN|nr:type 1 glutamine amidotransferase domain-containing protein [Sphingomonas hengshuiensis]AJP70978.1 peptidase C56 [Sphingomonas hengshuiensis]